MLEPFTGILSCEYVDADFEVLWCDSETPQCWKCKMCACSDQKTPIRTILTHDEKQQNQSHVQ